MKEQLPPRDLVWFDPATGRPTDKFFDWAKSIDERVFRDPVVITSPPANGQFLVFDTSSNQWTLQPATPPANGEVLIYNSGSGTWVPGAN